MVSNNHKIVCEFCKDENAEFDTIGRYTQFITSMQERTYYHGKPVFTDVYLNPDHTEFLLVKQCLIMNTVLAVKVVSYENMFNSSKFSKPTLGWGCMSDGSIWKLNLTERLVQRVLNVINGTPERNRPAFSSIR